MYKENSELRGSIWRFRQRDAARCNKTSTLNRTDSLKSTPSAQFSTPRGDADIIDAMDLEWATMAAAAGESNETAPSDSETAVTSITKAADAWMSGARATLAAIFGGTPTPLRRARSQHEEQESTKERWERLENAKNRRADWWNSEGRQVWLEARRIAQSREAARIGSGCDTGDLDGSGSLSIFVTMLDGQQAQLVTHRDEAIAYVLHKARRLDSRASAWPSKLMKLWFCGEECLEEQRIEELGIVDNGVLELAVGDESSLRDALVEYERALIQEARAAVAESTIQREMDEEAATRVRDEEERWERALNAVTRKVQAPLVR